MNKNTKMRAPTKEQVYHDKNTYKHKLEQAEHVIEEALCDIEELLSQGLLYHHPIVEMDAFIDGVRSKMKRCK